MRGLQPHNGSDVGGAVLIALVAAAVTSQPGVAHAGPAEDFIRQMPAVIESRAKTFDVDASIPLGRPDCRRLAGGRMCIVPTVSGIVINVLERDGRVVATQLAVTKANVADEKNIGRAINAVLLVGLPGSSQRLHDALSIGGAMCVLQEFNHKNGLVEFETTSGGCVITIDR